MKDQLKMSSDISKMDIALIHDYLANDAYWAKGRTREDVIKSMENSICIGLFDQNKQQLAFARIITDHVVFAWLMDFFVVPAFRNKGLGKILLQYVVEMPDLQHVNGIGLRTKDAQGFYDKFGFLSLGQPETWMIRNKKTK